MKRRSARSRATSEGVVSSRKALKQPRAKAASSRVAPMVLIRLALVLSWSCSLLTRATILGQHKDAIGKITLFFADPEISSFEPVHALAVMLECIARSPAYHCLQPLRILGHTLIRKIFFPYEWTLCPPGLKRGVHPGKHPPSSSIRLAWIPNNQPVRYSSGRTVTSLFPVTVLIATRLSSGL